MSTVIGTHYNTKLANLRISKNLSIRKINELTGISALTISAWETGKIEDVRDSSTPIFKIMEYCTLLGISYNQFCNYVNEAFCQRRKGKISVYKTNNMSPLREARYKSMIKEEHLLKMLGISKKQLHKWEYGYNKSARIETMKKMALAYGISLDEVRDLFIKTFEMFPQNDANMQAKAKKGSTKTKTGIKPVMKVTIDKPSKKITESTDSEFNDMLERLYGKVSLKDFMLIEQLVKGNK